MVSVAQLWRTEMSLILSQNIPTYAQQINLFS